MPIPERYQVTAERVDNRKRVQGYLIRYANERYAIKVVEGEHYSELGEWFVIPETIEPVAVKPIRDYQSEVSDTAKCPNCNIILNDDKKPKFCDCGMALDWSEHHE